ncbi:Serine/threonine-protein kinase PknD [Paenibacillus allorhizoplanae]|uniref:non-specific serine/threonine protein kinase n=1 Tax=Paenibacillus allorhizoplanae TaxID=2905648 RepID=A0ABM9BWM8_9BACL|nr:Serine/threonine-protein kinase PknD [Paenibacillus allorhizoplanae]
MKPRPQWQGSIVGGRYELVSMLGQGGMSQVYLARDKKLKGKRWAVKEVECAGSDETAFLEEAEMLAKLGHAQLPQLVDYFITEGGYGYLVMDYIEGPTLQDLFEKNQRELPIKLIVQIAFQLLDIFHYLHTFQPRPIIYRDLKPSNVMINQHNQVRLIDFGVARQFKQGQTSDTMQMGTIGFAAPEQYLGLQTDARTDLYTLGSMLYYLLSGGHYVYSKAKPLELRLDEIPETLRTTIHFLLQDQPQNRCQTAMEVKLRLRSLTPEADLIVTESGLPVNSHQSNTSDKLIVIGGLFAGVGATFTAITLARLLHALHIPNALVEQPTIEPDLYMLLYGDRHAPSPYMFPSEHICDPSSTFATPWINGFTTWAPINPDGFHGNWQASHAFKLLHMLKKPIILWDVSTEWEHPAVQELCYSADEIIVIVDSLPGKCDRPRSRQRIAQFTSYQQRGKKVHYIANGALPSHYRSEWQDSFPSKPLCAMPIIARSEVLQAVWKGDCIQDQPQYLDVFYEALKPFLNEILPDQSLNQFALLPRKSIFSRFNKRG